MQLNRYILASKAHVKCMYAWLNSCRQRFLGTVIYAWLRVYYLHGLEPFGGGGGGVVFVALK